MENEVCRRYFFYINPQFSAKIILLGTIKAGNVKFFPAFIQITVKYFFLFSKNFTKNTNLTKFIACLLTILSVPWKIASFP